MSSMISCGIVHINTSRNRQGTFCSGPGSGQCHDSRILRIGEVFIALQSVSIRNLH